jgi:hypothetical protein
MGQIQSCITSPRVDSNINKRNDDAEEAKTTELERLKGELKNMRKQKTQLESQLGAARSSDERTSQNITKLVAEQEKLAHEMTKLSTLRSSTVGASSKDIAKDLKNEMSLYFQQSRDEFKSLISSSSLSNGTKRKLSTVDESDQELEGLKMKSMKLEKERLVQKAEMDKIETEMDKERLRRKEIFVLEMEKTNNQREMDLSAREEANRVEALNRQRFELDRQFEYSASMSMSSLKHKMNMHASNISYACAQGYKDVIGDTIKTFKKGFDSNLPVSSTSGSNDIINKSVHETHISDNPSTRHRVKVETC